MKKLVAIALVLVFALTLSCTAFAETRSFVLTYVTDAEGIELEVEEMPELVITIDDEAMTCVYANEEGEEEGTVEILESYPADEAGTPGYVIIQVTLAEGDPIVMYVFEDQIEIPDDENDLCYILLLVDAEAAADAA